MNRLHLLLAAASVLALAACAPALKPGGPAATPGTLTAPPQSTAAPTGQSGTTATEQSEDPIVGPDGTVWLKTGVKSERYRADADDCFSFARAQVDRDERFENDAGAAISDSSGGNGLKELRQRMSQFERQNRLPRLFGQCMEAKGYTRG